MSIDLSPSCPTAKRFLQDLKLNGKSTRTQQSYCRAVRKFAEFLGHSPEEATEDQLRNYLLFLYAKPVYPGAPRAVFFSGRGSGRGGL